MESENVKYKKKLRIRTPDELSIQMEGLLVLKNILSKNLDNWFLTGGTLLGAYRDGDFIQWDWDVEVTVLTEEILIKKSLLLKNIIKAGFSITKFNSSLENFKIEVQGWGTSYEIIGRYLKSNNSIRARSMTELPAKFFDNIQMITLRGHEFPAPKPIDEFLEAMYGDWKIPNRTDDKSYYSKKSRPKKKDIFFKLLKHLKDMFYPKNLKEIPIISKKDLDSFNFWDHKLGWSNMPNFTKVDETNLTIFSTDEKGSRICSFPNGRLNIGIFGDDYCMCKNVNDHETFAWYLGNLTNSRVTNYGVEEYGLDQALLRLQKDYLKDPAKTIILSVNTTTIANCLSVYRHYMQPGKSLMIKPRFLVDNNNNLLNYIDYPFKDKNDLLNLKKYINHFREFDNHYKYWKKKKLVYYFKNLSIKIFNIFGFSVKDNSLNEFKYKIKFWKSHKELFIGMMEFYYKLSIKYGFKAIFLLQHSKVSIEYLYNKPKRALPWTSVIFEASKKFPSIKFLDESDFFLKKNNIDDMYTANYHSPKANKIIADYLKDFL